MFIIKLIVSLTLVVVVTGQFSSDLGILRSNLGINMGNGGKFTNRGIPVWGGLMNVDYGPQSKGIVGHISGSGIENAFRAPVAGVDALVNPL